MIGITYIWKLDFVGAFTGLEVGMAPPVGNDNTSLQHMRRMEGSKGTLRNALFVHG